ncbi:hypothetical protein ABPG75_000161 [Micractinium tetrahymenae]
MRGSSSLAASLLRRLRNSRDESAQVTAAEALGRLASNGASQQKAVAAAGGVPALVRRLCSSKSTPVQYAAAMALSEIARGSRSNSLQLVQAGVVPAMLRLLSSGDGTLQVALCKLANAAVAVEEFASPFVAQGGVAALLNAVDSTANMEAECAALGAVAVLCHCSQVALQAALDGGAAAAAVRVLETASQPELLITATSCSIVLATAGRDALLAAGAPAALLRALSIAGSDERTQLQVAAVLCNLSVDSLPAKAAITAAGGVQAMVQLLSSSDAEVQRVAARVLRSLADDARDPTQQVFAASGGAPALVALLRTGLSVQAQEEAALALTGLAQRRAAHRQAMAQAGGIAALLAILQPDHPACGGGLGTLRCLILDGRFQPAVMAAGGPASVVRCLQSLDAAVQLQACAILADLTRYSPENRAPVAAAGAVPALMALLPTQLRQVAMLALHPLVVGNLASASAMAAALGCAPEDSGHEAKVAELMAEVQPGMPPEHLVGAAGVCVMTSSPVGPAAVAAISGLTPSQVGVEVRAAPGCGNARSLRRCGGCGAVRYCSEACSRAHWREHRVECRRRQAEAAAATAVSQPQQENQHA